MMFTCCLESRSDSERHVSVLRIHYVVIQMYGET